MTNIRVAFADTDAMGIVHHSNYFRYFEIARVEWLRQRGLTYEVLLKKEIFFTLIEATCRYRCPARFEDELGIHIKFRFEDNRLVFHYIVENKSKEEISTGTTTHVAVDGAIKIKILPQDILKLLTKGDTNK